MMLYNYCYGYAYLTYLEYPVLLIQQYILIYLVLKYKRLLEQNTYYAVGGYFAVVLLFAYHLLPKFLLALLVVSIFFVFALKAAELLSYYDRRNTTCHYVGLLFVSKFRCYLLLKCLLWLRCIMFVHV